MPKEFFAKPFLLQAPWIERAERPNDIGNLVFPAGRRRGDRHVLKHIMDMNQIEFLYMLIGPSSKSLRISKGLVSLPMKENHGQASIGNLTFDRNCKAFTSVSICRRNQNIYIS